MPGFFSGEKDFCPRQQSKTNVWSVIKWGEKNELFPLQLTFRQNNFTDFYSSSLKQI